VEEVIDLRVLRTITVGDSTLANVPVHSIEIPSQLRMVSKGLLGLQLKLTKEIIPSLKGDYEVKKDWKTRLYAGSVIQVKGDCEWAVGDTRFNLRHADVVPLSKFSDPLDKVVLKQNFQSAFGSVGVHALLLLIFFTASWISLLMKDEEVAPAMQKVAIVDIKKLQDLKKPKPIIIEEPISQVAEVMVETPVQKSNPKPRGGSLKASQKPPKKRDIGKMGILGIQTVASNDKSLSVEVAAPRVVSQVTAVDGSLGIKSEGFGIGSGGSTAEPIARIAAISGEAYSGQLGDSVSKGATGGKFSVKLIKKEIEIRGGLDPEVIRQIIEERLSEVRYCYETALLKNTNLQGKISASWTIQADGSVKELSSNSDSIDQPVLHPCLKEQISKWKFPEPKGGGVVHVKYPFVFNPLGS